MEKLPTALEAFHEVVHSTGVAVVTETVLTEGLSAALSAGVHGQLRSLDLGIMLALRHPKLAEEMLEQIEEEDKKVKSHAKEVGAPGKHKAIRDVIDHLVVHIADLVAGREHVCKPVGEEV